VATSRSRKKSPEQLSNALDRAMAVARTAAENRAENIVILDMHEVTPVFDYFIVATGGSRRQLHAIADEIDQTLRKEMGDKRLGREGLDDSRWILLDFGDIVVHLFDEETRAYYDLEQLWSDAKRIPFEAPAKESPNLRLRK
jgi:ribosome-associated protein